MKTMFAFFLAILLIAAGCTSAPEDESKDTSSARTTQGGTETTMPTISEGTEPAVASTEGTATTQAEPDVLSDLKTQVKNLFSNAAKEYAVAYDTTMSGPEQPEYKTRMSYYIKGEDKMRVDTQAEMPGAGESRFYMLDGTFIICNEQTGEWACLEIPKPDDTSKDPKEQVAELQNSIETSEISELPGRVIAGVSARCYKMTVVVNARGGTSSWESLYCLSPEGVILYSDTDNGNTRMIQEATSYKNSVEDSDLVPPAEPKSLSF